MDNYKTSRELSEKMQSCLRVYADMLGAPDQSKQSVYGFVPGLQMTVEQQALEKQLDKLEQGIFQVLFTGGFSAGKSTLLNALMRKKVLRMAITAETAVITKIVFGQDEKVIIYEKNADAQTGQKLSHEMSVEQFFDQYRISQDMPDKFNNIDYVVLQQPGEGIGGSLVQLVDSPGTENSMEDTLTARQFAESASAIVYMINSAMPFVLEDKEYIASHYAGRHMKNIFFVCNRFDALDEQSKEDLRKSVRQQLKDVFTDRNGRFDEELFQSRVFYTDAYHSLCARVGEEVQTPFGKMPCDDSVTGVPEFESDLSAYLTADDRDKEAFRGYMSQLASKYVGAMDKISDILADYRKGADQLMRERDEFESKRGRLEVIISQIEESCRNCVAAILSGAKSEYSSCMNRINTGWDSYFSKTSIPFSIKDFALLTINKKNDAKVKEITKPFADAVQKYVKAEFDLMGNNLRACIEAYLNTLEKQLMVQQDQMERLDLPISIEDLRQALLGGTLGHGDSDFNSGDMTKGNLFQIILGVIGLDPEIILGGLNGKTSNGKAVMDFIVKNFLEYVAVYVVAWPIGVGIMAYRVVSMLRGVKEHKNTRASEILCGMRAETVSALQAEQEKYVMELENQLSAITRAGTTMADGIRQLADDYSVSLNDTIEKLKHQTNNLQSETDRINRIRATLLRSINEVSQMLDGRPLSEADIQRLAV